MSRWTVITVRLLLLALALAAWEWLPRLGIVNAMLLPPPPHVMQFLGSCAGNASLAATFADAFNDPKSLSTWFYDPEATLRLLDNAAVAA